MNATLITIWFICGFAAAGAGNLAFFYMSAAVSSRGIEVPFLKWHKDFSRIVAAYRVFADREPLPKWPLRIYRAAMFAIYGLISVGVVAIVFVNASH